WYRLARARRLADLGRWEAADIDFRKAIELSPGDSRLVEACRAYLIDHGRQEKIAEIIDPTRQFELLDAGMKKSPSDARAWGNRALFYMKDHRPERAAGDFARAFELEPTNTTFARHSAVQLLEAGDVSGYRRACQRIPHTVQPGGDSYFSH